MAVRVSPLPESVPVPSVVLPFLKVTVPVGPAPALATTVAVSDVELPTETGLTLAASVVVVASELTT